MRICCRLFWPCYPARTVCASSTRVAAMASSQRSSQHWATASLVSTPQRTAFTWRGAAYPDVCYAVASVYDNLSSFMPSEGWNVIVSSEVIEHLFSPRAFLRNMHTHLRPGGSIILTRPYHGYFKNLAISLLNGWDKHFTVDWEDGHIKFFSPISLTRMLREVGFLRPTFRNAGRLPLLWRSMVCRADKQEET